MSAPCPQCGKPVPAAGGSGDLVCGECGARLLWFGGRLLIAGQPRIIAKVAEVADPSSGPTVDPTKWFDENTAVDAPKFVEREMAGATPARRPAPAAAESRRRDGPRRTLVPGGVVPPPEFRSSPTPTPTPTPTPAPATTSTVKVSAPPPPSRRSGAVAPAPKPETELDAAVQETFDVRSPRRTANVLIGMALVGLLALTVFLIVRSRTVGEREVAIPGGGAGTGAGAAAGAGPGAGTAAGTRTGTGTGSSSEGFMGPQVPAPAPLAISAPTPPATAEPPEEPTAAPARRPAAPARVKRAAPVAPQPARAHRRVRKADAAAARAAYQEGNRRLFAGDPDAALAAYRKSIAAAPGYAAGYRGMGLAYDAKHQRAKAVAAFRQYLKLAPRARDARLIRQRIQRLQR